MQMISDRHDPLNLRDRYQDATPFPHIVLDDFLLTPIANKIATELEQCDTSSWRADDHAHQVAKRWMSDPQLLPQTTGAVLQYMNSPEVCEYFSQLTGIDNLLPDPTYLGGGVHVSSAGGRLGVHSDFNLHPGTHLHRRVNALIFLNREWNPNWRGQLELWDRELQGPVVSVNPDLNRLTVFSITDDAFHGVPAKIACPPDRKRFSLALYYYTDDRPDGEKTPFHWASWQKVS